MYNRKLWLTPLPVAKVALTVYLPSTHLSSEDRFVGDYIIVVKSKVSGRDTCHGIALFCSSIRIRVKQCRNSAQGEAPPFLHLPYTHQIIADKVIKESYRIPADNLKGGMLENLLVEVQTPR